MDRDQPLVDEDEELVPLVRLEPAHGVGQCRVVGPEYALGEHDGKLERHSELLQVLDILNGFGGKQRRVRDI